MKKYVPVFVIIALLFSVPAGSASADAGAPTTPASITCDGGACTLQAPLDGLSPLARLGATLGLSALQSRTEMLPAGVGLEIDQDLTLTLPIGELTLPKARLDIEVDAGNRIERLHGTVEIPFPTLGVLSDVHMVQPATAEIGLDTGDNLRHLAAPLDPERQYLFFNVASGMDVAGRVAGTGASLGLSAPAGQALTLVIDTKEPLVYLAGNVTVNTSGELLLAGPLQDLAEQSPLIPDTLPTWQRTQITISGLAGENVQDHLTVGGAWALDAGALGRWLGVEARPLALSGVLTLSADGMLLQGMVSSSVAPETVFDGSVEITAFIPFQDGLAAAFVETDATLDVPLAGVAVDAHAHVALPEADAASEDEAAPIPAMASAKRAEGQASNALHDFLAAAGRQAAAGADALKDFAGRSRTWLTALPEIDLGDAVRLPGSAAAQ